MLKSAVWKTANREVCEALHAAWWAEWRQIWITTVAWSWWKWVHSLRKTVYWSLSGRGVGSVYRVFRQIILTLRAHCSSPSGPNEVENCLLLRNTSILTYWRRVGIGRPPGQTFYWGSAKLRRSDASKISLPTLRTLLRWLFVCLQLNLCENGQKFTGEAFWALIKNLAFDRSTNVDRLFNIKYQWSIFEILWEWPKINS